MSTIETPRLKAARKYPPKPQQWMIDEKPVAKVEPPPVPIAERTITPDELLEIVRKMPVRPPTSYEKLDRIINAACRVCGITPEDLASKSRHKSVVMARECIAVLGHAHTAFSFPELARAIGAPNHSTMITAAQRNEERKDELHAIFDSTLTRYGWLMAVKQEAGLA